MTQSIPMQSGGSGVRTPFRNSEQAIAHKVLRNKDFFLCQNFYYMPFYVYILYSSSKDKFYIGYTSNIEERLIRHNQKSKGFTGTTNDWKIVYSELHSTKWRL